MEVSTELFNGCSNVTAVVVETGFYASEPEILKASLTEAIATTTSINTIRISMEEIQMLDFAGIASLRNLQLQVNPNGINTLDKGCFTGNEYIEMLTVSGPIYQIGEGAFRIQWEITIVAEIMVADLAVVVLPFHLAKSILRVLLPPTAVQFPQYKA